MIRRHTVTNIFPFILFFFILHSIPTHLCSELATSTFSSNLKSLISKMVDPENATIVDVGAGTGLFLNLFRSMVGTKGSVYAIDITPKFINFMKSRYQNDNDNETLKFQLCTDKSTSLPEETADIAFICDVYHHFEYPNTFMADLNKSMKTNGMVFMIDFYRQPSKMKSQ